MKSEVIKKEEYYQCEICKFYYKDKKFAEKCQAWCNEHHSCNMEITKHVINPKTKRSCC